MRKLTRLDRLALLTASRVHMSTPTKELQIIYGVLPIHLLIKQTGDITYSGLQHLLPCDWELTTKAKEHNTPHRKYWMEVFKT